MPGREAPERAMKVWEAEGDGLETASFRLSVRTEVSYCSDAPCIAVHCVPPCS